MTGVQTCALPICRLDVHGDIGGTGLGVACHPVFGSLDHEVDIQWQPRRRAQVGDHLRPECEIRHEMPVHDVDVDPVGAAGLGLGHGIGQPAEVGGQDGWRELRAAQRVPLSRSMLAGIIDVASPALSGEDLSYV